MNETNLKHFISRATLTVAILAVSTTVFAQSQNVLTTDNPNYILTVPKSDVKPNVRPAENEKTGPTQHLTAAVDSGGKGRPIDAENALEKLPTEQLAKTFTSTYTSHVAKPIKQTDPSDTGWQVAFAPYFYMTGFSGTIGARGRVQEVDTSFGSVLENLSFGLMGALEAKKGRFLFTNDIIWTKMGAERDTPGPLYNTAREWTSIYSSSIPRRVTGSTRVRVDRLMSSVVSDSGVSKTLLKRPQVHYRAFELVNARPGWRLLVVFAE